MQLAGKNLDGIDIVRAAAELAAFPDVSITTNGMNAIAEVYNQKEKYRLQEGEYAIVFYLDEAEFELGLIERKIINVFVRQGPIRCKIFKNL